MERSFSLKILVCIITFVIHLFFALLFFLTVIHRQLPLLDFKKPFTVPSPIILYTSGPKAHTVVSSQKATSNLLNAPQPFQAHVQKTSPPLQKQAYQVQTEALTSLQTQKRNVPTSPVRSISKNQDLKGRPSLSEIFKNAPSYFRTSSRLDKESGGSLLVVKQGDIKYYSFLKTFITHLNQHAACNHDLDVNRIEYWLQRKLIKQNLLFGVTIDRKGKVLATDIISSSGFSFFDELQLANVWSASPLPPIPQHILHEKVRVELTTLL